MSKKVVRSRESYIKNWTAAITGSFVLVSAQAAQAAHEHGGFREFRNNNPELGKRELRDAFRQQLGGGLNTCPVNNSSGASNPSAPAVNSINRHQQRFEARLNRHGGAINQSIQTSSIGNFINIKQGVDLDLTSQNANITLGEKLFGNTSSIEIQVGGETKTLTAGTKVTAAEYIAAKQVLAGVGQKVTIGNGGAATGGDVDLSAITGRGDVMRASDLTVPVNVTTTGDFSKGSEFRLLGDLTNSGTVHALDGSGNGRGGTLRADSILNNSGALIASDVDLNLQGDKSITNNGIITSAGNLTLTTTHLTNRGSISSDKDVNLNASVPTVASSISGLNVDNAGGTISAGNNINVNANGLNANLSGGDWLSKNLNLNAGAGTIDANVGNVTGNVVSTGNAVHFAAAAETLNIGETNLIDPTFYNLGNINFTGNINVAGADLTVIATGNITESAIGDFTISTTGAGSGGNLTMIAGANITATSAAASPNVNGGTPSDVTFNQGSIAGGSIQLGNVTMNTTGTAGGNGGNVLLAAFGGTGGGSGVIDLNVGTLTATGSSIVTGGNGAGSNGNVTLLAPNGIDIDRDNGNGSINTTGGTGGGGSVSIATTQPTSSGPVTYLSTGQLSSGSLGIGTSITNAVVDINDIVASGQIGVAAGSDLNVRNITSNNSNVVLRAGIDPLNGGAVVDPTAVLTLNGDVNANGGNILMETADNLQQGNNNDLSALGNVVLNVGITNGAAPGGADYNALGSVLANGSIFITVGDGYTLGNGAADFVSGATGVNIQVGTVSGTGNMTSVAFIQAGQSAGVDGSVNILVAGDYTANNAASDVTAGQGAGNLGTVSISAGNVQTVAGADILGNDVSLTANTTNGGDFDLAGSVTANKAGGTTGILSLTQNGTQTFDISDNDVTGGLFAQQINLTNNAVGGTISILNTNATGINFRDVTANAVGDITLIEPTGGGRDGSFNFTGTSQSGGNFTVLADQNIYSTGLVSGVNGDFRSNGVAGVGNIGQGKFNPFNIDFSGNVRIQALGGPSATAGNAFIYSPNGSLNFGGANSQVTGLLYVTVDNGGNLTSSTGTTVFANAADLFATGNIGGGVLSPFVVDAGTGINQGVTAVSTTGDVAIFDPTDGKIGYGGAIPPGSNAVGTFSFVTGGNLFVTENVTATNVILASNAVGGNIDLGTGVTVDSATAGGTTSLSADNISADPTSLVKAVDLNVFLNGGTGTVYTDIDGLTSTGSTGSLTINEANGLAVQAQGALTDLNINASQVSAGDVFVYGPTTGVVNVSITNTSTGNINVVNDLEATTSVTLDTTLGSGNIQGTGTVIAPTISLLAGTGLVDSIVNGTADASTTVTANSNGNDVTLSYIGQNALVLNASSGNDNFTAGTTDSGAEIRINGNLGGSGSLDLTTNTLTFNGAFNLAFNDASVQSLAASGLTINGAAGTFTTSAMGPGVTFTATDGNFLANGTTNFVGGDLFVTLANNNGINSFSVPTFGGLNGDTFNDVTIQAAVVVGSSLANLTNWNSINLLGNTIYNSAGDVALPTNLIFTGQDLAIIASGNVTAGVGTVINLSSTTNDGGNLTILAGFDTSPTTGGSQVTTAGPVTVTGLNSVGGNINLGGATINTSSTAAVGDAGDVFIYANGGTGPATGNVTGIGTVTATSTNGFGGAVAIGASGGVTVTDITTTGALGGGDVILGVGSVTIIGTPTFTNGGLSGGAIVPVAPAPGNLSFGTINAGTGDIALAGAIALGNSISGTAIIGDNLEVFMGAGSALINTQVNEVQADATFAATSGDLTINETGSLNVDHIDGNDLLLQVNATGDINLIGSLNVGAAGTVGLKAANITTLAAAKINADSLDVFVTGTGTVNTNVNSLTTTSGTGSLFVNEDDGIDLGSQATLADLTVTAGLASAGDITTSSAFSVGNLDLTNDNGNIVFNNNVTGTASISADTSGGTGSISGAGTLISPSITLLADTGNITANVNGVANASTAVTAEAGGGGDVSLTYSGTGVLGLGASSGNNDFTVATTGATASVDIQGNIDGAGDLDITTNTLSFNGAFTLDFDTASVQSLAASGLTLTGNGGTFDTNALGAGVTLTATDGNFVETGTTNFLNGDLAVTLANNNGSNSVTLTGILNGDNTNDVTVTAAVINGDPNTQLTNWANVFILQGNTIVNNSGDVTLGSNLTFQGQDLAIIASGNVTMTTGLTIDLSSNTVNGGTLTVLAGYDSTGTPPGQTQTPNTVTLGSPSATGGNIAMSGVNIITSSTAVGGSAGDVLLLAAGGVGGSFTSAGTVTVGNITANGDANGGLVVVGGTSDVTVGNISTIGNTGTDGSVVLAVGSAAVTGGAITFTNGTQGGPGAFVPAALSSGNLLYGTINAGTGDVSLGGALGAANTISGGVITADTLAYIVGAGTAISVNGSNTNRVNVDATTAAGGTVSINEGDNVIVDDVTGSNLTFNVNTSAGGDVDIAGNINVGTGTVNFTADDVTQSTGTLTANTLGLTLTGNATLTTNVSNLANSSFANMTLNNTGNLTVNNITTTGFSDIFNTGNLTVANAAVISGVDRLTFQTVGGNPGTINIGTNANIQTAGAVKTGNGEGDVIISQGALPTKVKNLKGKNLNVTADNTTGFVLTGKGKGTKKITALAPDNNLTGTNATLLIKAATKGGVTLGGGTTIVADPPSAPAGGTFASLMHTGNGSAQSGDMSEAISNAPSALSSINSVPTLTSASSINLNNPIDNTLSNLATANTNLSGLNQMEDDSYMVTYAPLGQIVDGNVCSDMDFGFVSGASAGSGNAVATMAHSDCVTLDNGSALFVPSKDMTVVTPKGSVKLAANSVAYVNVNSDQLSVYDINDNHKASVVVSTGGRDLTLSPGRHLVVTTDKAKTFADVNPIESIMHRSVNRHELGAGKRAFVSEFSIPSAVNVVKPLKAVLNSSDADAKKVAARILKTSAVVMMVGGQAAFDYHTKPRTVALSWK